MFDLPKPVSVGLEWAATIAVAAIGSALLGQILTPHATDFASFWAAGVMTVNGHAVGSYDALTHQQVIRDTLANTGWLPFGYPPPFLFFLLPIGVLPFPAASAVWTVLTLGVYCFAAKSLTKGPIAPILAFPPVPLNGLIGQNGFWSASLLLGGVASLASRPILAGCLFGTLAMKPQLAAAIPLALLAGREWRALAATIVSCLTWIAASVAIFGMESWRAFFQSLTAFAGFAQTGAIGWAKMVSVYAGARQAHLSQNAAMTVHMLALIGGLVVMCIIWRRTTDPLARAAILAPVSLMVSPYLFFYDQIMLIASLIWLARCGTNLFMLALFFVLPCLTIAQLWMEIPFANLSALLSPLIVTAVWHEWRKMAKNGAALS